MRLAKNSSNTFYQLMRRLLTHPVILMGIIGLTIVQVLLTVYLPILIGGAIDAVVMPNSSRVLIPILVQMLLVIVFSTLLQWLTPILCNKIVYHLISELRQSFFEQLHRLPLSYLDKESTGDLVARISSDSEQLTNGLIMMGNLFMVGVFTIILTLMMMARLDSVMMLTVVVLTPVSLLVARFIARKSAHFYRDQTISRGDQAKLLDESISQLKLIQSFNAQEQFEIAFKQSNENYARYSQSATFVASTVNPSTRFINAVIYALLAGMGAFRIMTGSLTVGSLTTFLSYANQYTKPFNDMSSVLSELQSALACAERLFSVIHEPIISEVGLKEFEESTIKGAVSFKGIDFSYNKDRPLITDFNLDVPEGARVAIVGPTGSGKSTLINLLMRFYEYDKGTISLDDKPITDYTRESLRHMIGMVLQDTWLKVGTIRDNIVYGAPDASQEEIEAAAKASHAEFFIQQLPNGYDTYLADGGESLSVGERQLLAITRLFVRAPKLLLLDEATSSIDTRTEILIQSAFDKLMTDRTSFIIAHRLSTIQSADIILVMVDGYIAEKGNHRSLMKKKGVYYQMQTAQGALRRSPC